MRRTVALFALALPLGACRETNRPAPVQAAPHAADPEVVLLPSGDEPVHVKVELARTQPEQQKGLMYRDKLAGGHGMLFIFEQPHPLTFWMHNTYIPLDMVFIGADKKVVGVVENATPLTDTPRGVPGDSLYVLEVPGGYAGGHHVARGTEVRFVDID